MENHEDLKVLTEKRIRQMLIDMDTAAPSERRALGQTVEALSRALAGFSGLNDSTQSVLQELVAEALQEKKKN